MFGIGGLSPAALLASTMMGPMGGIMTQLAQQVVSQFGQQLLQNLGDQMGLAQGVIDQAKDTFLGSYPGGRGAGGNEARDMNEAIANYGESQGASPSQIGDAQRAAKDAMLRLAGESMETEEAKDAKAGGKGGGGWLRALARALGESADKAAANLEAKAGKLDDASPSESAEYQADAQAFSMLMNAINTAIKSIGEALGGMSRKQ